MAFILSELSDYDALLYEALHQTMDHLIDLGARCNAHSDVLDADDDDSKSDDEGPHPVKVLRAQLNLNGAEDEVQEAQHVIQTLSQILITRHTRNVIHNPERLDLIDTVRARAWGTGFGIHMERPAAGAPPQDSSDVHHDGGCSTPNSSG